MDVDKVRSLYASLPERLDRARRVFGRPLTLTEKILVTHATDFDRQVWERGKAILRLRIDHGLVRSFARIHETNLEKQGVLPLTFKDPRDYERIERDDRVSVVGLAALEPGEPVTVEIKKPDGRVEGIDALHTMTREQIAWFRAGSALNAGPPIDLATGGTASLADATLAPGDTQVKPGKDNR